MIKIMTDSGSQLSRDQADQLNVGWAGLQVSFDNGESYLDYVDLTAEQWLQKVEQGLIPSTSQPPIGVKLDLYEQALQEGYEVIDICMADGLSGTYQTACMAASQTSNPDKIHVFNAHTLCLPEQVLVKAAVKMAKAGKSVDQILSMLEASIQTDVSFVVPKDFPFMVRGGRTNNATAFLGGLLKLVPVITFSSDATRLEKFAIVRTYKKALKAMLDHMESKGVNGDYVFCIGHAANDDWAEQASQAVLERFPAANLLISPMGPGFMTQGGPGCISFQAIKIVGGQE